MASRMVVMNVCRSCFKHAAKLLRVPRLSISYSQKRLFITTAVFSLCEAKQKLDLQAPDEDRLNQGHVLKVASASAADTVATLLSQTAFSLIETQQRYRDHNDPGGHPRYALCFLITPGIHCEAVSARWMYDSFQMIATVVQLLEHHVTVLGHAGEEERVLGIIAEARGWLQAYQKHIEDLEQLLSSVQTLADASAEVAFLAGSEFTSTSLGERVYQVTRHTDNARQERQRMEAELEEVEASCAEAITKRAEREERKKKAEDAMFGGDDSFEGEREEAEQEKLAEKDAFGEQLSDTAQTEERDAEENTERTF